MIIIIALIISGLFFFQLSTQKSELRLCDIKESIISATLKLDQIFDCLRNGDIKVGELKRIAEKQTVTGLIGDLKGNSSLIEMIIWELKERLEDFHRFEFLRKMYLTLCKWIPPNHCFMGMLTLLHSMCRFLKACHVVISGQINDGIYIQYDVSVNFNALK